MAEFSAITVIIEYTLRHPVDGIQFVLPTESYPHVSAEAVRFWLLTIIV